MDRQGTLRSTGAAALPLVAAPGGPCLPLTRLAAVQVYYPYLLMNKKRYAGLLWTRPEGHDKMDSKVRAWGRAGGMGRCLPGREPARCGGKAAPARVGLAGAVCGPRAWARRRTDP
jgi:hypothetical protein